MSVELMFPNYNSFGGNTTNAVTNSLISSNPSNLFDSFFSNDFDIFGDFMKKLFSGKPNFSAFSNNFINTNNEIHSLDDVYDSKVAGDFARIACENALQTRTIGNCAKGVNDSIENANLANGETRVPSAYMTGNALANHQNFKEVNVSRNDLKNLPAGCVIVWDKGFDGSAAFAQHGHVAITLGNGKEASDHISTMANHNTRYRIFVPVKKFNTMG